MKCQELEESLGSSKNIVAKAITLLNFLILDLKTHKYFFPISLSEISFSSPNKALDHGLAVQSLLDENNIISGGSTTRRKDSAPHLQEPCFKLLLLDDLAPVKYAENTLMSICQYFIGVCHERLKLKSDYSVSYKKGLRSLPRTPEQGQNSLIIREKLLERLSVLQYALQVKVNIFLQNNKK